ncbi:MAG: hypothetical protein A2289_21140 [Deltaproteobacteria bacterium RIFOXYA12_FULL_58_15]|nr:MAG: hypothetical protein A2289_21140 [Deltaproteobacteria bacterium RIFOXYA12_FULL_58_15]OGR09307.1 MAG: hypothetical protein A2341_10750 [Deltaproteobacteria bacterium RIFOXYB12_FULL_58_9]
MPRSLLLVVEGEHNLAGESVCIWDVACCKMAHDHPAPKIIQQNPLGDSCVSIHGVFPCVDVGFGPV